MRFGEIKKQVAEGWGRGNDRVRLPDEPADYYHGKGPLQDAYNELYDKLVPSQGAADTIEGEVLRAASKIVYRHYNDGDEFNQASFDQLEPYIGTVTSYDDLAHKSTEFALKANGNYTPNNGWDSLDVMEYGPEDDDYDDEDDYDDADDNIAHWAEEDDEDDLREDEYEDDYEDEEDEGFFVAISDEEDGVFIGMLVKEDGKWRERTYKGNPPQNWGGTYMGYLTPQDVMSWINKDYGRSYEVQGPMSEDEANEYMEYMGEGRWFKTSYGWAGGRNEKTGGTYKHPDTIKAERAAKRAAKKDAAKPAEPAVDEGWESGPEERAPRERDPDAEYDARRQEKADAATQAQQAQRPQEKYYTLVGRGPNMEPNYEFPGEYASQEEAIAARAKLMADPSTPNPRMIGISTRTRYLDEGADDSKSKYNQKPKQCGRCSGKLVPNGKKMVCNKCSDTWPNHVTEGIESTDPIEGAVLAELSTEVILRLAGLQRQNKDTK